jgi:hypothetical protein
MITRIFALFLIILLGCTVDSQSIFPQDTPNLSVSNLEIPSTLTQFPEDVNPLTGLPVADVTILERRPIVVKISNAPALVRPQAGLSQADIAFEHYVEGGLTRISAVFYSQAPERVGSVRSARLIDHELVPMFDGILAFSGGSLGVEKYIFGSEYVNRFYSDIDGIEDVFPGAPQPPSEYADRAYKGVLYGLPYFWRDEDILIPHNMFVNVAALWELAATQGHNVRPRLVGLSFADEPPPNESRFVHQIDVRYRATRVLWTYDAEQGVYLRQADGLPHHDFNTEAIITANNVIILHAEHSNTLVVESMNSGQPVWSIQIALWGSGDATLFRDGRRYDGRWERTERENIFTFYTESGELLPLKPGNTWIQVMPTVEQLLPDVEWVRDS